MELEDQVCSFEQAKKLIELEVAVDTTFYWDCFNFETPKLVYPKVEDIIAFYDYPESFYPAPTIAELGILLDGGYYAVTHWSIRRMRNSNWGLFNNRSFKNDPIYIYLYPKHGENLARAESLIWLIKNDRIIPGELKL
jgi:hypothetical protein